MSAFFYKLERRSSIMTVNSFFVGLSSNYSRIALICSLIATRSPPNYELALFFYPEPRNLSRALISAFYYN
jgi:hypothetical protein